MINKTHESKSQLKKSNDRHGLSRTRGYSVWRGMIYRCYRPEDIEYHNYGGRGIKVCDEWKDIQGFYPWFIKNSIEGCTMDRIDSNKDYCPQNCRFSTSKEQSRNKRTVKYSLEKAEEIRELYRKLGNQREVSKIVGIDYRYISLIIRNKRWAI